MALQQPLSPDASPITFTSVKSGFNSQINKTDALSNVPVKAIAHH